MTKRNFDEWLGTFTDNINSYTYYVDFEGVYANAQLFKRELALMQTLIGSKNIREEFKDLASLSGVFAYISASGSASDSEVVMNALKQHIGIIPELKAIYTACENNGVNEGIKATIRGYLYNLADVESTMKEACIMTFWLKQLPCIRMRILG